MNKDNWISVQDELPKLLTKYKESERLLMVSDGEIFYGCMTNIHGFLSYDDDGLAVQGLNVTHWQPLPAPPTKWVDNMYRNKLLVFQILWVIFLIHLMILSFIEVYPEWQ